jgi:nucleoid-associated protein YgaU
MSGVVDTLKKPLGPLPLGAWVIVVAAGVGIGMAGRGRFGSSSSSADDTAADPGVAPFTNPGQVGVQSDPVSDSSSSGTPATIYTNEEWRTAAIKVMVDRGTPPDVAMSAVSKLYAGTPLSDAEFAAINLAVRSLGPPPSEVPPMTRSRTTTNPAPAPVPSSSTPRPVSTPSPLVPRVPSAPRPRVTVTVRSGDTLSAIGRRTGVPWGRIYDANRAQIESVANQHRAGKGSDGGHWIYPGEVLVIP